MEASIVDLRRRMAEVLRALDRNESVKILYRGQPRAVLVPAGPRKPRSGSVTRHPAFGIWKDHDGLGDVHTYVRALRRNRFGAV